MTTTAQVRRFARLVNGGTPTPDEGNWNGAVNWATPVDLGRNHGGVIESTERTITEEGLRAGSAQVPAGSLILSTRAPVGYVARAGVDLAFNQGCKGLVTLPGIDERYLAYALINNIPEMEARATGTTFLELSTSGLAALPVPVREQREQTAIADFLDRETAQIDALVAEQRELVRLLEERRLAVVVRAVTNGIDNNVALKASGHPWVSAIPEHWTMKRLSWLFAGIGSGTTPEAHLLLDGDAGEIPWVTTGELREGVIDQTSKSVSAETLSQVSALRVYPAGTLLIAMYGATIGRLGTLGVSACVNQACCVFSKPSGAVPRFVYYALLAAREHLINLASGGGQPNINQEKLRALRLPTPSVPEQQVIADHLDTVTGQIESMIAAANESIALMLERRAALISAAVIGRIDPRTGQEIKEAS